MKTETRWASLPYNNRKSGISASERVKISRVVCAAQMKGLLTQKASSSAGVILLDSFYFLSCLPVYRWSQCTLIFGIWILLNGRFLLAYYFFLYHVKTTFNRNTKIPQEYKKTMYISTSTLFFEVEDINSFLFYFPPCPGVVSTRMSEKRQAGNIEAEEFQLAAP